MGDRLSANWSEGWRGRAGQLPGFSLLSPILSPVLGMWCRLKAGQQRCGCCVSFLPSVDLFYSPVSQHCAGQGHRMPGGLCILVHLHLFRFNNSNRLLRSMFSLVLLKAQSLRFLIPLLCLSRWKLHHVRVERLMAGVGTIDTCPLCAHLPELPSGQ